MRKLPSLSFSFFSFFLFPPSLFPPQPLTPTPNSGSTDLGLDSSSDEAMLETHRNNVTTMLTQVVPALQQLDASRGGQPSGSASMGSHAMPYFQPQPQAEGKGAGSYQPGVAPYSLSNAPPPGSMASPPSYPNPLFNQEKK